MSEHVTMRQAVETVAAVFDVSPQRITGPQRMKAICRARFAAYLVMYETCPVSTTQIGRALGDRDHTTVLHGIGRAKALCHGDPVYREKVSAAIRLLAARIPDWWQKIDAPTHDERQIAMSI